MSEKRTIQKGSPLMMSLALLENDVQRLQETISELSEERNRVMKTTFTRIAGTQVLPVTPLPLDKMGINLCSVDSMVWTKQEDGQLVSLTINFIPAVPCDTEG